MRVPDPKEAERRLWMTSQLRSVALELKRAAIAAYERGEIPFRPELDIRSDVEYWRNLAREKGIPLPGEEQGDRCVTDRMDCMDGMDQRSEESQTSGNSST